MQQYNPLIKLKHVTGDVSHVRALNIFAVEYRQRNDNGNAVKTAETNYINVTNIDEVVEAINAVELRNEHLAIYKHE